MLSYSLGGNVLIQAQTVNILSPARRVERPVRLQLITLNNRYYLLQV